MLKGSRFSWWVTVVVVVVVVVVDMPEEINVEQQQSSVLPTGHL